MGRFEADALHSRWLEEARAAAERFTALCDRYDGQPALDDVWTYQTLYRDLGPAARVLFRTCVIAGLMRGHTATLPHPLGEAQRAFDRWFPSTN